jgi:phage gpG-like protein
VSDVTVDDKEVRRLINSLIKNVGQISDKGKKYVGLLSSVVLGDVVQHFAKQQGPDGTWKSWSDQYRRYMIRIGKGGNLILSDTGRLRQGWQPARYRLAKDGVLWFNPVQYARAHDEGLGRFPERKFTWLSKGAIREIENQTVKFIETTQI